MVDLARTRTPAAPTGPADATVLPVLGDRVFRGAGDLARRSPIAFGLAMFGVGLAMGWAVRARK